MTGTIAIGLMIAFTGMMSTVEGELEVRRMGRPD